MKRNKIIFWIATIIIFLFEGLMPLSTLVLAPDQFNVGTKPLGYPDYFAYALIVCKAVGYGPDDTGATGKAEGMGIRRADIQFAVCRLQPYGGGW